MASVSAYTLQSDIAGDIILMSSSAEKLFQDWRDRGIPPESDLSDVETVARHYMREVSELEKHEIEYWDPIYSHQMAQKIVANYSWLSKEDQSKYPIEACKQILSGVKAHVAAKKGRKVKKVYVEVLRDLIIFKESLQAFLSSQGGKP